MTGNFFQKSKKKKKPKFNNPYKVPNDTADEIRRLSNKDLVDRATSEYNNWKMSERMKKTDGELTSKREELKKLNAAVNTDKEVVALAEKLDAKKEEVRDDMTATVQEEIKNLNQPHVEDIRTYRGQFSLALDEISNRKQLGAFDIRNGTGSTTT